MNSHLVQSRQAIRHNALTTGLVDGRNCAINNGDAEPFTRRGDCRRQPGWSATCDQYLRVTNALLLCLRQFPAVITSGYIQIRQFALSCIGNASAS